MMIDWDDWIEEDISSIDFEYVYVDRKNIFVSLKEIKNGLNNRNLMERKLKLFKEVWTSGWNPENFIPLSYEELEVVKKNNFKINFFDNGSWTSLPYNEFVKLYPQFKI